MYIHVTKFPRKLNKTTQKQTHREKKKTIHHNQIEQNFFT